jgi:hypothetical protein
MDRGDKTIHRHTCFLWRPCLQCKKRGGFDKLTATDEDKSDEHKSVLHDRKLRIVKAACAKFEYRFREVGGEGVYEVMLMVVFAVGLFWSLFFFDIIGDVHGPVAGGLTVLVPTVGMALLCLAWLSPHSVENFISQPSVSFEMNPMNSDFMCRPSFIIHATLSSNISSTPIQSAINVSSEIEAIEANERELAEVSQREAEIHQFEVF